MGLPNPSRETKYSIANADREILTPVSRDQSLRRERGQGGVHFLCSADHEQDWQATLVTRLIHPLLYNVMTMHRHTRKKRHLQGNKKETVLHTRLIK